MHSKGQSPEPPRRILVRGLNWLGDAVMSSPALHRLRQRFPKDTVVLLTQEKLADLWMGSPAVNQVLTFSAGESVVSVARRLRSGSFDRALILPNSPRSALEAWLARIPERIGFARPWRNWFLTRALPPRPGRAPMRKRTPREIQRLISPARRDGSPHDRLGTTSGSMAHHVHDYLHLAAALGASAEPVAPRFQVSPEEVDRASATWLSPLGPGAAPLIGLNPSAAYGPAKRWPTEYFAAVAREIGQRRPAVAWLAFGSAQDHSLCEEITTKANGRALNLAGKTSLRELMALLSACQVVLTNDTGPMHLAAALGTPVVVPFGSTSPVLTGPGLPGGTGHYLLTSAVPCSPCFRRICPIDLRCMHSITVDRVTSAVLSALDSHAGAPASSRL